MLRSLVNKPDTLSIVCVFKGVYQTLQLCSDGITLQMKENYIIKQIKIEKWKHLSLLCIYLPCCA